MKDLQKLVAQCEAELRSIGIQPGKVLQWTVNTRAKRRWGQCVQHAPGVFTISIAQRLLQDSVSDQAVKDTIVHELLHTVKGCHGHTGLWAQLAAKVNLLLPQYHIKRTASSAEKGIESIEQVSVKKYAVRCVHCGTEYARVKESKLIQHPEKYRCGLCGNKLVRVR